MPEYKISITDSRTEEVVGKVRDNLLKVSNQVLQMNTSRSGKVINKIFRMSGMGNFEIDYSVKWIDDRTVLVCVLATAPIKEEVYDNQIKSLGCWGKMKIEKITGENKGTILNG